MIRRAFALLVEFVQWMMADDRAHLCGMTADEYEEWDALEYFHEQGVTDQRDMVRLIQLREKRKQYVQGKTGTGGTSVHK